MMMSRARGILGTIVRVGIFHMYVGLSGAAIARIFLWRSASGRVRSHGSSVVVGNGSLVGFVEETVLQVLRLLLLRMTGSLEITSLPKLCLVLGKV